MNREQRRKAAKFARSRGIDVTRPDLGVVTAPYKTDYIEVVTEQSRYTINLKDKLMRRIEGDDASHLTHDGDWYPYEDIYSCSVSFPLRVTWYDGDRLLLRETTPILEVIEMESVS